MKVAVTDVQDASGNHPTPNDDSNKSRNPGISTPLSLTTPPPQTDLRSQINYLLDFVGDPTLASDFRQFQKTDFNLPLALFLSFICITYFIVHIRYQEFWTTHNPSYIAAFAAGLVTVFSSFILMGIRIAASIPPDTFAASWAPLHRLHTRVMNIDQSSLRWMHMNNIFVLAFSTSSSLFILARVLEGFCDPAVSKTWQQQQNCNDGGVAGLPFEEYTLDLFSTLMIQIFLKGASYHAIINAYILKVGTLTAPPQGTPMGSCSPHPCTLVPLPHPPPPPPPVLLPSSSSAWCRCR